MAAVKPKQRHGAPDATKLQASAEKASQVGRGGWSFAHDEDETRVGSRLADPRFSLVYLIMAPDYRGDRSAARSATQPRPMPRRKGRNGVDNGKA